MAEAAFDGTIQVNWHPKSRGASVTRKDSKKECVFTFKVEDFKVKGMLTKEPEEGKFSVSSDGSRSFTFTLISDEKPILKCKVNNLPGDISGKPSHKLMNNFIAITVKKSKQEPWEGVEDWSYPALPDMG